MQTRFTPLVKIKKSSLDQCERDLARALHDENSAKEALERAYSELQKTQSVTSGTMRDMLSERKILELLRDAITQKREWLDFASKQVAQQQLKMQEAYMEYEKYKYLETKEVEMLMQKRAKLEAKQLDESALQSYMYRQEQA